MKQGKNSSRKSSGANQILAYSVAKLCETVTAEYWQFGVYQLAKNISQQLVELNQRHSSFFYSKNVFSVVFLYSVRINVTFLSLQDINSICV